MITTMTKLACFAGCAAFGLGSAWFALAAPVDAGNTLKPCASLDEISSASPGCMPLEAPGPCGPLDPVVVDSTNTPPVDVAPDAPPLPVDTISYYRDGERFETTFTDSNEVVRRTGSYVLVLSEPEPVKSAEPPTPGTPDEALKELKVLLEEVEKRVDRSKKFVSLELNETTNFDPKLVPPGKRYKLVKDGTWTEYRADASRNTESGYRLGYLDGGHSVWHDNGSLAVSGSYLEGRQTGRWLTYSPAGTLVVEHSYVEGKLDGAFFGYHEDGQLSVSGQYAEGIPTGQWTYRDRNGNETVEAPLQLRKSGKRVTRVEERKIDLPPPGDVESD